MAKYVDANGLLYVLQKMKAKFALKTEIPTVPTVGNGTITIKKNSTTVDSFTTNQSADKDINITLAKGDVGLGNVDNTADADKSVESATKLTPGAAIAGRMFNGTSNIVFSGKSTTEAATATKEVVLDTGGTIHTMRDGTFLFVKFSYTPSNTGNMYLKIGETSWPVVDGWGNNITNNNKYIRGDYYSLFIRVTISDTPKWQVLPIHSANTTYVALTQAIATAGTENTGKLISAKVLHDSIVELLPTHAGASETGLVRWDSSTINPGNLIGISSLTSDSKPILTSLSGVGARFITSGTFDAARIPDLAASKITSGTLSSDRLPSIPIGKLPTLATLTDTSDATTVPTSKAVRTYVMGKMADVAGALVYKGTVGGSSATVSDLPASHTKGWYYIVKEAGTYAGEACEAGDMIICNNTGSAASNTDWDVVQSNIESMSNADIDTIWNQAFAA